MAATALSVVSCALFEDPVFVVTPQSAEFGSNAGSVSLSVSSSKDWTASTDADWVTLSKTSGEKGECQVRLSVKDNTKYDDRSATVTFSSESKKLTPITIRIVQAKKEAFILNGDVLFSIPDTGGDITVKVETNMEYEITYSSGAEIWIKENKTKALNSFSHSFTVTANDNLLERKGTIYFTDQHKRQYAVSVTQEGKHQFFSMIHTVKSLEVPKLDGKNLTGTIDWGDGATEEYKSGTTHEYAEAKEYTLVLDVKGATSVTIGSIEGVSTIDFSKFRD